MSEFDQLIGKLRQRLSRPGSNIISEAEIPQAAVALILREEAGQAQFLVIQRAVNPRDHWSGHLALPGGRRDPTDSDLIHTATREVAEEVGIDISERELFLGELTDIAPRNPRLPRIIIRPFVILAPQTIELRLNHEVNAAFWVGAMEVKVAGRTESVPIEIERIEYRWPAYPTERGPIWGITERILTEFLTYLD
jgi:8-oxo-dGTP pyrophosphatase MutT (NUDIX family)